MSGEEITEGDIKREAEKLLGQFALGPEYRYTIEALLETYAPEDITAEHIEAMRSLF